MGPVVLVLLFIFHRSFSTVLILSFSFFHSHFSFFCPIVFFIPLFFFSSFYRFLTRLPCFVISSHTLPFLPKYETFLDLHCLSHSMDCPICSTTLCCFILLWTLGSQDLVSHLVPTPTRSFIFGYFLFQTHPFFPFFFLCSFVRISTG